MVVDMINFLIKTGTSELWSIILTPSLYQLDISNHSHRVFYQLVFDEVDRRGVMKNN